MIQVLGHRLLPRRSAASKALNMICSPQRKKVERKKKEKEENGDSNDVPEEKNKVGFEITLFHFELYLMQIIIIEIKESYT